MRHKYSQVILQTLGGSIQKDYEYEKKLQEYKEGKNRMATIKKVIDNFPRKMEGYKHILDTIAGTCDFIFDKSQKGYFQFMHNITSAHRALTNKLIALFNQFGQLKNSTNVWIKELNQVTDKCHLREQCRKNYEHYEKKLFELNTDRMKEIKKNNKISESDHERFMRNIGKFQKAGKEYVYTSNQAFRAMEQFLNIRYDRIVSAMVSFVEAERSYYNEASHIMNFFSNVRNNAMALKKTLITTNTKYDASNFIKGRVILNMSAEEIFSSNYKPTPPPNGYGPSNNPAPGPNQGMYGMGQSYNTNSMNKGIVNPFSADNTDLDNNNMNNNFGRAKTFSNNSGFNNQSTRDTFALNNPYNTQANPYSGPSNNNMNNNFEPQNNFGSNNCSNPYDGNNNNPYDGNNNDPFGGNNHQPYDDNNQGGNNDYDPYGGGNNDQNQFNNNQNNFGNDGFNEQKGNNNNNNDNLGNNNKQNNDNNDNNNDEDPFDF